MTSSGRRQPSTTPPKALVSPVVTNATRESGLPWVLARVDHVASLLEEERELMRAFCVMSFEAAGPIHSLRSWYSQWLQGYERQMAEPTRPR